MVSFSFAANRKMIFGRDKTLSVIPYLKQHSGTVLIISGHSITSTALWKSLREGLKHEGIHCVYKQISGEPSPDDIDRICREVSTQKAEAVMALGGGSVLDAGKAVSAMLTESSITEGSASVQDFLEGVGTCLPSGSRLPLYALPTTAGTGSECTKNAVISRPGKEGFKKSLRHDNYIPDLAIIDSSWLDSLPQNIAASCGMDAFSQLLESYISTGASPLSDALALEGLEGFIKSFSPLLEGKAASDDFDRIALGASLSGLTLANAGLGTVHGIAGTLGGLADLPHGTACGLLLPPVMRKTFKALQTEDHENPTLKKMKILAAKISGKDSVTISDSPGIINEQLENWAAAAALPSLETLGFNADLLEKAAIESANKNNPYSFSKEERLELLKEVF